MMKSLNLMIYALSGVNGVISSNRYDCLNGGTFQFGRKRECLHLFCLIRNWQCIVNLTYLMTHGIDRSKRAHSNFHGIETCNKPFNYHITAMCLHGRQVARVRSQKVNLVVFFHRNRQLPVKLLRSLQQLVIRQSSALMKVLSNH